MRVRITGRRYPNRGCRDCEGSGFVRVVGGRVRKCSCWVFVTFRKSSRSGEVVRDGKLLACGSDSD